MSTINGTHSDYHSGGLPASPGARLAYRRLCLEELERFHVRRFIIGAPQAAQVYLIMVAA